VTWTKTALVLALFGAIPFLPAPSEADDAAVAAQLQRVIDVYVKERGPIEGLSGAALQVDRGAGRPIISVFAGGDGLADTKPIGPDTLFQIGSNTKEFIAALILKLEAAGKLKLDDTIGKWLPQYPAWKDVTIRSLLQMTSPIPNYSETVAMGEIQAADIHHQFSAKDLIGFVDPGNGQHFPPATGWFYSNTNYILAGLIITLQTILDQTPSAPLPLTRSSRRRCDLAHTLASAIAVRPKAVPRELSLPISPTDWPPGRGRDGA
jgi:D-alanyl-D-alanine carboxypeptidase